MSASAAIADPLLRQAFGQRARPSAQRDRHRRRWRSQSPGLRAPVSRRGSAISPRTVLNNAGWLTRDWLIWFIWFVLFIWFVSFKQTNQTGQINKRSKPGVALDAPRSASVRQIFANKVGYQLYIQILAQYNSEVLHVCCREGCGCAYRRASHVDNLL